MLFICLLLSKLKSILICDVFHSVNVLSLASHSDQSSQSFSTFYYWIQNTKITWNCIIDDKNQTWNIKHLIWFIQFSLFVIKNYNEKLFLSFELIVPTLPITFVRMQKKNENFLSWFKTFNFIKFRLHDACNVIQLATLEIESRQSTAKEWEMKIDGIIPGHRHCGARPMQWLRT